MKYKLSIPLLALSCIALNSCAMFESGSKSEFVNTPYISKTVGVGTAGFGEVEMEGILETDPSEFAKSKVKLNIGAVENVELAVAWQPFVSVRSGGNRHRGTGDVILGAKVKVADASDSPVAAIVEMESRLPSGSAGSSSRRGESDTLLATSIGQSVGPFSLIGTYELALLGESGSDSINTEHGAIVAASWRANDRTRLFVEATAGYVPSESTTSWYGGFGGGYKVMPQLELQAALQVGLDSDAEDYMLVFGFSGVIGKLFQTEEVLR